MPDLKNVYRRYSLAFATCSTAICIGFVMQSTEAAVLVEEESVPATRMQPVGGLGSVPMATNLVMTDTLPSMPTERSHQSALLPTPVLVAVADDNPIGILPVEESVPNIGCQPTARANTAAGALISLNVQSDCHAGEVVTIVHEHLSFQTVLPSTGQADLLVPALAENAVVKVTFGNGDSLQATALVDSLSFYDRVVVQWQGVEGAELHAREFGADYGSDGHVWRDAPRNVSALVGGRGGFLVRLGDAADALSAKAEIYTFPSGISGRSGDVAISVEAEVTEANCGKEITAQSSALRQGVVSDVHDLRMQMPDCSAVGEFLVLKNLVEDLTIAQN